MLLHPLFGDPSRTHFVRSAHDWVRIRRSEIGERLAQQDILQAQGEDILAKGEIPVCSGAFVRKAHDWVRISRPKIGKRLAQRGILQAQGAGILAAGEYPSAAGRVSFLRWLRHN